MKGLQKEPLIPVMRATKCPPKLKLSFAEKAGKRLASFMLPALGCCQ